MTPQPGSARFTLMRCGLINLFHYANQVFEAEDGHLLLRGSNGSGKSTAVELTLPLLLDGNLTAANLSTSDGQRSIRYHLLLDGMYPRRLGYSWAQFACQDADGERWVTLALGVKVAQDTKHDPWFLVWDTPVRVDPDVMLVRAPDDGNTPLPRTDAGKLPGVEVFDSAEDYRRRVNALLFGFSEPRYDAMIKLMRRLRSAQLGKSINVAQTTELLELALPELDAQLLAGVGAKLDELESLRTELGSLRDAHAASARFVARYRDFARNIARRELEGADQVVRAGRKAAREERELERRREAAQQSVTQAQNDLVELEEQRAHAVGELQALHDSERWQAVERINAAAEQARQQRVRADAATATAHERGQEVQELAIELTEAQSELTDAQQALASTGAQLKEACLRAGLSDSLQLPLEQAGLGALDAARRARQRALELLDELQGAATEANKDAERTRQALDRLETRERELRGRRDEAETNRNAAQAALVEEVEAWVAQLQELRLQPDEREALLEAAAELTDERRELEGALEEPMLRAAGALSASEQQVRARLVGLQEERARLGNEQRALRERQDPEPQLAPWRDADQPGRPLWRLCDFSPDLVDPERDQLERALEAAGLLHAHLDEDGALRAEHGQLLIGAGAPPVAVRSLADVLAAEAPSFALTAALRAVAVLDADADGRCAVALDGSFALGPLRGRGALGPAELIGAQSRQRARERRIAEIDRLLHALDADVAAAEQELRALAGRGDALRLERRSLPTAAVHQTVEAWARWRALGRDLDGLREELIEAREQARQASEALAEARARRDAHASEHGLPLERQAAQALRGALSSLLELLAGARQAVERDARACEGYAGAQRRHETATGRLERAEQEAANERQQAEQLEGYAERLGEAVGADREQVLGEARALEAALAQLKSREKALRAQERDGTGEAGRLGAERDAATAERERLQREADRRGARLGELDGAGLIGLALGGPLAATSQAWDGDRIATSWREAREQLVQAPEVTANAIYREFDRLRAALDASLGMEAVLDLLGDVPLATAIYGGGPMPIAAATDALGSELERQQDTLADREQQLFEEFLFGDVAGELRTRITDADAIARAAAQKISGVRTSSGIGVDLQWELRRDLEEPVRKVIGLLRRADPRALPPADKQTLMAFFRDRLAEARAGAEHATLVEHLHLTLDYRRWFRFRIFQLKGDAPTELTRKAHGRDSGGEKSVTLHLPLLAAYHALLTGAHAHAPRLVALDEAFAGIDRTGQQQLLEVLDDNFDMDFVLTSEKLWCFEPQLRRLGVYQLRRFEGAPISTVHWRWYGDQRRKEMVLSDAEAAESA